MHVKVLLPLNIEHGIYEMIVDIGSTDEVISSLVWIMYFQLYIVQVFPLALEIFRIF